MFSFPAGQVGGVPIRIHFGWILLALLGISMLEPQFAAQTGGSGVPMAIAATALILLAILLHELGHALMAQRLGLHVRAITLFLTGGLTELQEDVEQPTSEFKIALAGPMVSLLLALVAGGVALLTSAEYRYLALVLAAANGLLALFNLLPCFPLDGGRVLRAGLWLLHDDLLEATWVSTQVARVIGWSLIGLGVVVAANVDLFSGVLTMVLGWMTGRAAVASYLRTSLEHTLRTVTVRELMSQQFRSVSPQITLDLFVGQYVLGQGEQGFPVVQAERLMGLISVRNLRAFSAYQWRETMVGQAMTPVAALPTISPDDTAHTAYQALLSQRLEQLPVTDNHTLQGMITYRDVMACVQDRLKQRRKR